MWIKICGMTDATAVQSALTAGADAIGFVFAPSPRRVSAEHAHTLALPARGRALCVAVTQHPDAELLKEILAVFAPDILQTDVADFAALDLPAGLLRLPVLRAGSVPRRVPAGRFLFEGPSSGTGRVADWSVAHDLARKHALVLAGGLNPDNVAAAIVAVRPAGVDVSSGVEAAPGRKSPEKVAAFVAAARAA
ncbi:MAG: phosphoribosylanthranilate isomerase [Steroidobacteraceae bacterium]